MEMIRRVRIEILVDAPIAPKLARLAEEAGITGHTLLRTASGRGRTGEWSEDLLTGATNKFLFLTICNSERADRFISTVEPLLDTHDLVLLKSEVEVVRSHRF